MQELTASLFTEANKMVRDANEKRMSTEKCLAEVPMKIDGLETEVTALKALVLTSTPSQPNHHLHPQLSNSSSKVKLENEKSSIAVAPGAGFVAVSRYLPSSLLRWFGFLYYLSSWI